MPLASSGERMSESPAPSSVYATALLGALIRDGVRDVVVCPGSRSQALALAAAQAEAAGAIRLHVRLDERSAAFFALGVARETGAPAPVIVTSGSAVANLFPAVIEAHESRVPMLLLTADRPADMRGTRSNQTTRQAGMFDAFVRLSLDIDVQEVGQAPAATESVHAPSAVSHMAMRAAFGARGAEPAGPVQLNLQFREPLSGWPAAHTADFGVGAMSPAEAFALLAKQRDELESDHNDSVVASTEVAEAAPDRASSFDAHVDTQLTDYRTALFHPAAYLHEDDALTVVIAGEGAGLEAEAFAREAGLPLLAEVVSGVRFGREAITGYTTLIDDPDIGGLIERAVVFGHPSLSRQVPSLLKREDVDVVVVDPHAGERVEHFDPSGGATFVRSARVSESYNSMSMRRWLGIWVVADRALREARSTLHEPDLEAARATGYRERNEYARTELAVSKEPVSREMLVESVWRASWPHDRLVLAASRLVRVLDRLAAPRRVEVRANRGLAGIDGTVATSFGIAVASQAEDQPKLGAGTTRVLIGDLALLHDAGSLLLPTGEPHPRLQVFVGNDGGGTIFDTLEAAQTAERGLFDRVMYTPQRADLESLARAYGWQYRRIETRGELDRLLTEPVTGPQLVEVPLAR